MRPIPNASGAKIIQILSGIGNPSAKQHATHLTQRFAQLVNGEAIFLPANGVCPSVKAKNIFLEDPFVKEAIGLFDKNDKTLVGIGALKPSSLLAIGRNVFGLEDFEIPQSLSAVGDICQRFFNEKDEPIK